MPSDKTKRDIAPDGPEAMLLDAFESIIVNRNSLDRHIDREKIEIALLLDQIQEDPQDAIILSDKDWEEAKSETAFSEFKVACLVGLISTRVEALKIDLIDLIIAEITIQDVYARNEHYNRFPRSFGPSPTFWGISPSASYLLKTVTQKEAQELVHLAATLFSSGANRLNYDNLDEAAVAKLINLFSKSNNIRNFFAHSLCVAFNFKQRRRRQEILDLRDRAILDSIEELIGADVIRKVREKKNILIINHGYSQKTKKPRTREYRLTNESNIFDFLKGVELLSQAVRMMTTRSNEINEKFKRGIDFDSCQLDVNADIINKKLNENINKAQTVINKIEKDIRNL